MITSFIVSEKENSPSKASEFLFPLTQLSNSLYGSSRKLVSMYRTLLEYFLFVWIFSCFVGEREKMWTGRDGEWGFLCSLLLWQNPRPRTNKGKVFAGGFVFCHLFFHKSSHNMRIDLINQTMQIDTGNVGVNGWMFRVISGVRFWHVGDAGNWKTLCLIFREKCGEKKLKLVNIWRVVCRCLCAVSVC